MERLLVIALMDRCLPNRGTPNFTSLTDEEVALLQAKAFHVVARHWDSRKVVDVDAAPLDSAIPDIGFWHADVLRCIQHLAKPDIELRANCGYIPILRDDTDLCQLVAGPYCHTAPIL